jgi:hypothetical protein
MMNLCSYIVIDNDKLWLEKKVYCCEEDDELYILIDREVIDKLSISLVDGECFSKEDLMINRKEGK